MFWKGYFALRFSILLLTLHDRFQTTDLKVITLIYQKVVKMEL